MITDTLRPQSSNRDFLWIIEQIKKLSNRQDLTDTQLADIETKLLAGETEFTSETINALVANIKLLNLQDLNMTKDLILRAFQDGNYVVATYGNGGGYIVTPKLLSPVCCRRQRNQK